jgi:putative membrane protein insertion efficiency factor
MFETLVLLPQRLLMLIVRGYRFLLKPWLGSACRFEPTCSQYALDALERHGAVGGALLAAGRLLRCHPWCDGGCDPAPEKFPNPARGLFTRFSRPPADDTP